MTSDQTLALVVRSVSVERTSLPDGLAGRPRALDAPWAKRRWGPTTHGDTMTANGEHPVVAGESLHVDGGQSAGH